MTSLENVARRGAPAQREQAHRLISALEADIPGSTEAARALVAAYLHDPYLDRG